MNKKWTYKKIGEVGTLLRGKGIQKTDFIENGQPCIHYGQIHTAFNVSTDKHLSTISTDLYNKSIIASTGDVLLTLTSEDVEGSCKSTAWLGNYDVAVSSDAAIFKHSLNPKFFVYYTRSNSFFVQKSKYAKGFKVTHIKTSDLAEILIPVPNREEQNAIVFELDKINELILLKKSQLKELEDLCQSIFYDAFGDPISNSKGFPIRRLSDVCIINPPKKGIIENLSQNANISFLPMEDLKIGCIYFTPVRNISVNDAQSYTYFNENDLLMAKVTPCFENGKIAIMHHLTHQTGCGSSEFHVFRVTDQLINEFLYFTLKTKSFIADATKRLTGTSGLRRVPKEFVQNLLIGIPPIEEQISFRKKIALIEEQKRLININLIQLNTLLASRMQYWFD